MNYRKLGGRRKSIEERFDIAHKIAEGIGAGLTFDKACRCAGSASWTVHQWHQAEERGDEGMEGFWQIISNAKEMQQIVLVSRIMETSRTDWRAAAWILERRHSDVFGRKVEVQADLRHSVSKLSEDDLVLRLMAIEDGIDIEIANEAGNVAIPTDTSTGATEEEEEEE